jgi:TolB protein
MLGSRRILASVIGAAALVAMLLAASPAGASYPGTNGLLAVVRNGDIWTMATSGRLVRRLTRTGNYGSPRWSPDGKRIAFQSTGRTGPEEIFIINADGSGLIQVTTAKSNQSGPTWSPDGKMIAFESDRGGRIDCYAARNIYALRSAAPFGSIIQVTHEIGFNDAFYPAWSPDGKSILFDMYDQVAGECGTQPPTPQLHSVSISTGIETSIAVPCCGFQPNWAPGAKKIAFWSIVQSPDGFEGPFNLWQSNPDGSALAQITHFTTPYDGAYSEAWAPYRGTSLVFQGGHHYGSGIYQINANGTGLRTIVLNSSTAIYGQPDWQP